MDRYWSELGFSPEFQGFGEELASLERQYGGQNGCFLIALEGRRPVACGGFRRLDEARCEAKRVFVDPGFRGRGLGSLVLHSLIGEAKAAGYRWMMADTLFSMTEAQRLYESLGFARTAAYAERPTPNAIYLALDLNRFDAP